MKKFRKVALMMTAMVLCCVVTAVGTYAYLHMQTETKNNVFASERNISIQLREPSWDGFTFDDEMSDGTKINGKLSDTEKQNLGLTQAKAYVPGQKIPKNPQVKNNGGKDAVTVRTAIKVQYYNDANEEVTYEEFAKKYLSEEGIAFSEAWKRISKVRDTEGIEKYDVYLYNEELGTGNTTDALFSTVPLSEDISVGTNGKLPGFTIRVTAYAIQSEHIGADSIETKMNEFIKKN